ncbi:DNA cytosine methyltransferase [Opitutales bacterium]|nr:DNA cytosine methyltransferase [Opitutales bacterium]
MLKVLDLFSGCGGLSHGLSLAGMEILWANEIDSSASKTFRSVHKKTRLWNESVEAFLNRIVSKEEDTPQNGEVDLVCGGPPCQGFSGYNRFRSVDDPRNSLVESFLSIVEILEPKFVLIENVPGMLQLNDGKTPDKILKTLSKLGYNVDLGILQAGHYGVPQNRWRVFIIAAESGLRLPEFPQPTYSFPRTTLFGATNFKSNVVKTLDPPGSYLFGELLPHANVGHAISDIPQKTTAIGGYSNYSSEPSCDFQLQMRMSSENIFNHYTKSSRKIMIDRISAVPKTPKSGWLDMPEDLQPKNLKRFGDNRYPNRFGRLWHEGIFNTIVTEANAYWGRVIHPEENRVISVRESARAQSIPDNFIFSGKLTSMYRQIGNSVPPFLAKEIGSEILKSL